MQTDLLGATVERAKWAATAGPMVFLIGCWFYAQAHQTGDIFSAVMGGLIWMSAVAQWSLTYMEVKR